MKSWEEPIEDNSEKNERPYKPIEKPQFRPVEQPVIKEHKKKVKSWEEPIEDNTEKHNRRFKKIDLPEFNPKPVEPPGKMVRGGRPKYENGLKKPFKELRDDRIDTWGRHREVGHWAYTGPHSRVLESSGAGPVRVPTSSLSYHTPALRGCAAGRMRPKVADACQGLLQVESASPSHTMRVPACLTHACGCCGWCVCLAVQKKVVKWDEEPIKDDSHGVKYHVSVLHVCGTVQSLSERALRCIAPAS